MSIESVQLIFCWCFSKAAYVTEQDMAACVLTVALSPCPKTLHLQWQLLPQPGYCRQHTSLLLFSMHVLRHLFAGGKFCPKLGNTGLVCWLACAYFCMVLNYHVWHHSEKDPCHVSLISVCVCGSANTRVCLAASLALHHAFGTHIACVNGHGKVTHQRR